MFQEILINLDKLFNSSPLLGLAVSFLAGILASFSPCIYPMIPITLGVLGAVSSSSKLRSFLISLVFVLGIATLYTLLGIISSLLGILIGSFLINPLTYFFLGLVFLILGLSEWDLIKLKIPFFSLRSDREPSGGFAAIFIFGLLSALAMIPCNFPVLFSILNLIALKQDVLYGGLALFLFSLGFGSILIVLGVFTSLIRKLPKQRSWLIMTKLIIGFILLGVSFFFLYNAFQYGLLDIFKG